MKNANNPKFHIPAISLFHYCGGDWMRLKKIFSFIILFSLVFIAVSVSNVRSEEVTNEGYRVFWKVKVNSKIISYPLVDDKNNVYVLNKTGLVKLDNNGTVLWFTKIKPHPWFGFAVYHDTLYVPAGGYLPFPHQQILPRYLYSISAADGRVIWKYAFPNNTWGGFSKVVVSENGHIFVNSDDGYTYAINPNGTLRWKLYTNAWDGAPQVIYNTTLYISSDKLYAISFNGSINWIFAPDINEGTNVTGFISTVDENGNVYLSLGDYFYAISPEGKMIWRKQMGFYNKPIVWKNLLYVLSFSSLNRGEKTVHLYCMDLLGNVKWDLELGKADDFLTPVLGNNKIYISTTHIKVGENVTGDIYAISLTGKIMWHMHLNCSASISTGSNKTLYVAAENGILYSIVDLSPSPEPDEKTDMISPELYYIFSTAVVIVIGACVTIYYIKGVKKKDESKS